MTEKKLRSGFTTGSCAAAASYAACCMLLGAPDPGEVTIITPAGRPYCAKICEVRRETQSVQCTVYKDAGDDPDVTDGMPVCALVSSQIPDRVLADPCFYRVDVPGIPVYIDGGQGIGRVTRAGLDQPVGAAAINHVPREMITREVCRAMDQFDGKQPLYVEISLPLGEDLAKSTYNPRLGIEGGLSVLGTTGIVEPMSTRALLDTIYVEMKQKRALGRDTVIVSPGSYGRDFLLKQYGYDLDRCVKISNYVGEAVDMARELGFQSMLLAGHIGKMIKVSGGIMNTHSHEADCRMELIAAAGVRIGLPTQTLAAILDAATTEAACDILYESGVLYEVMAKAMERIESYLNLRAGEGMRVEAMMYVNSYGLLAKTAGAEELLYKE